MTTTRTWHEADGDPSPAQQMLWTVSALASNSYRRTRPMKGEPTQIMGEVLGRARKIREWVLRSGFPVPILHLNAAIGALSDAILDFRKSGGIFEPAKYVGGADPSSAEHLGQFAQFLRQRVNQKPVPGKQWAGFAEHWEAFIEDFARAYKESS